MVPNLVNLVIGGVVEWYCWRRIS